MPTAKMAGTSGISAATPASFSTSAHDVAGAIDEAEQTMNDNEVPVDGRILYISENAYKYLKQDVTRELANEGDVSRVIETFDRMPRARHSVQHCHHLAGRLYERSDRRRLHHQRSEHQLHDCSSLRCRVRCQARASAYLRPERESGGERLEVRLPRLSRPVRICQQGQRHLPPRRSICLMR